MGDIKKDLVYTESTALPRCKNLLSLSFVAIVRVRVCYVDFFVFFFVYVTGE